MPLITTPGAPDANSYETVDEFDAYLATRLHIPPLVAAADVDTKERALISSTRLLDQTASPYRRLETVTLRTTVEKFYISRPHWTGSPATTTQILSWPRTGMLDRNGNPILATVNPQPLKDAVSELAISLIVKDITVTSSQITSGLTSLKAGPVAMTFKDLIRVQVLPDAVYNSLVQSWVTDWITEPIRQALFQTLGNR